MSKIKLFWFGGGLIVLAIVVAATLGGLKKQPVAPIVKELPIVRIGYREHNFYAPLFVGLEKGYFTAAGLKVEPIKFESTNQLVEAMIAGRVDAALGGVNTPVIFSIEAKAPGTLKLFTLFKDVETSPVTVLIVKQGSAIKTVKDLNNKKISAFLGSSAKLLYTKMVEKEDLRNTTLVQMEPKLQLQALEAGQTDAAIVIEPLATLGSYKKISTPLVTALWSKYFISDFPLGSSVVANSFAQEHPDLTKKLVAATYQAIDFMDNNVEETKTMVAKYVPTEPGMIAEINNGHHLKLSSIDASQLQKVADLLEESKEIQSKINVLDLFLRASD